MMKNDEKPGNPGDLRGYFTDRQHSSSGFIVRMLSRLPGAVIIGS
jgi:hypothetical protein